MSWRIAFWSFFYVLYGDRTKFCYYPRLFPRIIKQFMEKRAEYTEQHIKRFLQSSCPEISAAESPSDRNLTASNDTIRPRPNERKSEKYWTKGIMLLVLCCYDFGRSNERPVTLKPFTRVIHCCDWF